MRLLDETCDEQAEPRDAQHRARQVDAEVGSPWLLHSPESQHEDERGERDRDVDDKDHAPARGIDEPASESRADHEGDPAPGRPLPDRRAPSRTGERRREHGERGVSQEGAGDPLDAAEDDQRGRVRRRRAQDRGDREERDPDPEDTQLAEDVAERAADEDEGPEREQVGVDDPLLRGEPAAEVVLDRLQRDIDDRPVDERHRRAEDARDERPAAQRARQGGGALHTPILRRAVGRPPAATPML